MTYPLYDLRTERHDLPLLFAGQSQKESYVNELAARVDPLLHLAIESEAATPLAVVTDGQSWLVGTSPTGDWAGQDGKIAARAAGNWLVLQPTAGMILLSKVTGQQVRYLNSWQAPPNRLRRPAGQIPILNRVQLMPQSSPHWLLQESFRQTETFGSSP